MHASIEQHRTAIADICRRFGVQRLEVFGSAARATDFRPDTSDADFLVEFAPGNGLPFLHRYFGLQDALSHLLGRPEALSAPPARPPASPAHPHPNGWQNPMHQFGRHHAGSRDGRRGAPLGMG